MQSKLFGALLIAYGHLSEKAVSSFYWIVCAAHRKQYHATILIAL